MKKNPNLYTFEQACAAVRRMHFKTSAQYQKTYSSDPRLPSRPDLQYAGAGWIDWFHFIGKARYTVYGTYEEARVAVQLLQMRNRSEYNARRKENPKLPSHPHLKYAGKGWSSWRNYLGVPNTYATYEEAKEAARALNIKNASAYKTTYRQDPRLPRLPAFYYRNIGWESWRDFLGAGRRARYATYAEAQAAARALNISTSAAYAYQSPEDPRLPRHPHLAYAGSGWTNWYDFLGSRKPEFYQTYEQAESAVRRLEFRSTSEYLGRYKEDPKLPSSPNRYYAKEGWVDWYQFLGLERSRPLNKAKWE